MLLLANVDDVSGELIPHAIDGLMAGGACSVHVVQAITKKGRLEYLFFVDTRPELVEETASYLARELGTLGVRVFEPEHLKFDYRFCRVRLTVPGGGAQAVVRIKQLLDGEGQVLSLKAELEDLRAALQALQPAAPHLALKGLKRLVEQVAQDQEDLRYKSVQAEYLGGMEDEQDPGATR